LLALFCGNVNPLSGENSSARAACLPPHDPRAFVRSDFGIALESFDSWLKEMEDNARSRRLSSKRRTGVIV
ncbi:MAG TPA: hypothetical protein VF634_09935, partial [Pyrinomonadaceae bacterium]